MWLVPRMMPNMTLGSDVKLRQEKERTGKVALSRKKKLPAGPSKDGPDF
jgi:hypothetical protein